MSDVAHHTGLPRSSAHRILDQLVRIGWLARDDMFYSLGTRLMELGSFAVEQNQILDAAGPYLRRLHDRTALVVHLAVLDGTDVVYLGKVGDVLARLSPVRAGSRMPAGRTALGKVLTAYSGAPGSEYDAIREAGIAFDRDGNGVGLACIAAPVGAVGCVRAAVSVCGPAEHVAVTGQLVTGVQDTARAILRRLEDRRAHV
ncbi:IclR family transcriptional regulator [Rhodococcus sp. OK519]|nr:IclR family transcriptional regulator [Rhodococcus sp. OK519]